MREVFPKALGLKVLSLLCKSIKQGELTWSSEYPCYSMGSLETAPTLGKNIRTRWFGTSGPVSPKGHFLMVAAKPSLCVQRQAVGWGGLQTESIRTKIEGLGIWI